MNGLKFEIGNKYGSEEEVHKWTCCHIGYNNKRIYFSDYPPKFGGYKTKRGYRVKGIEKNKEGQKKVGTIFFRPIDENKRGKDKT
jgi:hypothetical protein